MQYIHKLFISTFFVLVCSVGVAQHKDTASSPLPLYQQFPAIPTFKLLNTDSSSFIMRSKAQKNRPTVVMFFSPTCSHCQQQITEFTSHSKALKNINFILATTHPISEIKSFVSGYGINKFSNFSVGHDAGALLVPFYNIHNLPTIFVYSKKGQLLTSFPTNITTEQLLAAIK
jgi:thioredoxin-related protein